jgi:hypothetical protein
MELGLKPNAVIIECDTCERVLDAFDRYPRWVKALAAGMYRTVTCWRCKEAKDPGSTKERKTL